MALSEKPAKKNLKRGVAYVTVIIIIIIIIIIATTIFMVLSS